MSIQRLQSFIDENEVEAKILKMTEPTPTVPTAAKVLNIEVNQVIKSLVFETPEGPVLVVGCGVQRVDAGALAKAVGTSKRKTKFAKAERALEITGYVVGSMPPFGHLSKLPTYLDPKVLEHDLLYGGGGEVDAMLEVSKEELLRVTAAEVTSLLIGSGH